MERRGSTEATMATFPSTAEVRTEAEARLAKAHTVAAELLKTEAHYVAILHLIDQVSRAGSWQRGNNVFCVADQ